MDNLEKIILNVDPDIPIKKESIINLLDLKNILLNTLNNEYTYLS